MSLHTDKFKYGASVSDESALLAHLSSAQDELL